MDTLCSPLARESLLKSVVSGTPACSQPARELSLSILPDGCSRDMPGAAWEQRDQDPAGDGRW